MLQIVFELIQQYKDEEEVLFRSIVDKAMAITKLDKQKIDKISFRKIRKDYCTIVQQHINLFNLYHNAEFHNIRKRDKQWSNVVESESDESEIIIEKRCNKVKRKKFDSILSNSGEVRSSDEPESMKVLFQNSRNPSRVLSRDLLRIPSTGPSRVPS
ncbi:hypothetical protein ABEB36_014585 [Hypothenemus hampei]|uniref:Uncharacterized protein n=1 Tax=Hypothenemus hampei TaxID=57062 RepID=A0ABD1E287_HYPHA